jgi:hypothetical protein
LYEGLDQLMNATDQIKLIADGKVALYNRSTLTRNEYFPGMLINAAETNHMLQAIPESGKLLKLKLPMKQVLLLLLISTTM